MPSSFAKERVKVKFSELIAALSELQAEEQGQSADKAAAVLAKVEEARNDFETQGNPQSGGTG